MSHGDRDLSDDFEDDLPGGSLDLEKGSAQVGSGVASSYDGGGIDFDDELMDDGPALAALELDIPGGGRRAPAGAAGSPPAPDPGAGQGSGHATSRGPVVPDLAFDEALSRPPAPPPARPQASPSLAPRTSAAPARTSGAHPAAASPSSGQIPPAPPSDSGAYPPANALPNTSEHPAHASHADGRLAAPAKPSAAAVIASYPAPPEKVYQAPMYAVRVVLRQLELRSDLESLRRRRSPDVPLYEAALKAYEPRTFRLGMAINGAAIVVATFIFFLPVIFRFIGD